MTEEAGKAMVKAGDRPLRMTQQIREAAWLDAQGCTAEEIAEVVNVHPGSVTRWRSHADYVAERDRVQDMIHGRLEPLLEKLKIAAVGAYDRAVGVMLEAMEAEDEGGRPLWPVRIRAAEAVFGQTAIKALLDYRASGDDIQALSQAVVNVVINVEGQPEAQVVEGDAEDAEFTAAD